MEQPYNERRVKVKQMFDQLGRGSQRRAAVSLGLRDSKVSNILNGAEYQLETLRKLEAWARGQLTTQAGSKAIGSGVSK